MTRIERVALPVAVVLVATLVRLSELGLVRFTSDQSNVLGTVRRFVRFGEWPRFGPDIGPGLYGWGRLGPLHFYLSAPPFALTHGSPEAVIGSLAAAHAVAVALTVWAGARFFGARVGWFAGAVLAVAPYPVFISRELVNFAFIPPIAALLLVALLQIGSAGRRWWLAVALPCVAAAIQLHATAWVYAPLLGLAVLPHVRRWRSLLAPAGVGALLALIVLAPYLRGLAAEGFEDLSRFLSAASHRGAEADGPVSGGLDAEPLRLAFGLLDLQPHPPEVAAPTGLARVALPLAIALGLLVLVRRLFLGLADKRESRASDGAAWHAPALLLTWFAVPPLLLTSFQDEVYIRHLVVLYPVPALLAALTFASASRALTDAGLRRGGAMVLAIGVLLIGLLAVHTLRFRSEVREQRWISAGMPLADQQRFADHLVREEGFTWDSHRRLHLPGLGDSRYGLRYLIEERTALGQRESPGHASRHYVLSHGAQQPRCVALPELEPVLTVGPLELGAYPSSVVAGSVEVELPGGTRVSRVAFDTRVPRGRAVFRARLEPAGAEAGTWVVVTNGCVDTVRFGGVLLHRGDCAWKPIGEPWPVSLGFALPAGAGDLEIEVLVPDGKMHLDGYDLPYRVLPDPRAPGAPFSWGTIKLYPLAVSASASDTRNGTRYLE